MRARDRIRYFGDAFVARTTTRNESETGDADLVYRRLASVRSFRRERRVSSVVCVIAHGNARRRADRYLRWIRRARDVLGVCDAQIQRKFELGKQEARKEFVEIGNRQ